MKKIVLLFTVTLFAVAFVSCSKEYLFQNADKEIMAGLSDAEKHSADSNNKFLYPSSKF